MVAVVVMVEAEVHIVSRHASSRTAKRESFPALLLLLSFTVLIFFHRHCEPWDYLCWNFKTTKIVQKHRLINYFNTNIASTIISTNRCGNSILEEIYAYNINK
ncbi:hypothetical protein CEAn_00443 [Coxiella endosymbiont of Amblyomma nuttalli]|nr:hypothetical protein CEAn_00443 [Coxiella endosymbiont of Amblyomma nuttalli]